MLKKVKEVLSVVGLCLLFVFVALFRRRSSDGQRGSGNVAGDGEIKRDIDETKDVLRKCGVETDKLGRNIERAESILREAIERSKK